MAGPGFTPVAWLPGKHLETIVPALLPARLRVTDERRIIPVDEHAAVRVQIALPRGEPRGTLLLLHGIGGSCESRYVLRTAAAALAAGWAAVRMNCRNCGGTEALSKTLYNAGQSDDVGRVLADLEDAGLPRPFAAAGFSLGGNIVLRYAGTSGSACLADAVVGVNPPVDLEACCRSLERPENSLYHWIFTWTLCRLLHRIRKVRPLAGPVPHFFRLRTLRRLDTLFTAPDAGYRSAEEYYAKASAGPHLPGIEVPALVVSAENDPFVPIDVFEAPRLRCRNVRFVHPRRGGHLGYWQAGEPRFWAGEAILEFLDEVRSVRDKDVIGT